MNYGICDQTLVPVRIQPGEKYEMINQLLFGDVLMIKDNFKDWLLIETIDDQYDGWVDQKQLTIIGKAEFNDLQTTDRYYVNELAAECESIDQNDRLILTFGSCLPKFRDNHFKVNGKTFFYSGAIFHAAKKADRNSIISIAMKYIGAPYLWGGRSAFGIDCSGFVQLVYKMCGIFLPRDSSQQVNEGDLVSFIHEAKTADLAFFGDEEGKIFHVGIMLDDTRIIHASGKVRIDNIDHQGIFNVDTEKYTHQLRVIKSFFK